MCQIRREARPTKTKTNTVPKDKHILQLPKEMKVKRRRCEPKGRKRRAIQSHGAATGTVQYSVHSGGMGKATNEQSRQIRGMGRAVQFNYYVLISD